MNPDKLTSQKPKTENISIEERFKESKVRNEKGVLLKVFHFSDENIQEFSIDHVGKNYSGDFGFFGNGIYFTDFEEDFKYGSKRYSAYLNLKNPFIIKNPTIGDINKLHGKREDLLNQGYDGVMVWEDSSGDSVINSEKMKGFAKGRKAGWVEICVFKPEDIFFLKEDKK